VPHAGSQFRVLLFVESERDLVAANEDRPPDQVRLLHHQVDRFLLGTRKRTLFEHRTASADEVKEPFFIDVTFQELAIRRIAIDVSLVDVDPALIQKTSGCAARRSRGFPVEGWLRHIGIVDRGFDLQPPTPNSQSAMLEV
jgi:hypothetical protein